MCSPASRVNTSVHGGGCIDIAVGCIGRVSSNVLFGEAEGARISKEDLIVTRFPVLEHVVAVQVRNGFMQQLSVSGSQLHSHMRNPAFAGVLKTVLVLIQPHRAPNGAKDGVGVRLVIVDKDETGIERLTVVAVSPG